VRTVGPQQVALEPLSLGDYRLTGTFRGVMHQPAGPYAAYTTTLYLAQDGARVTGVTRLAALDGAYWGDLQLEGDAGPWTAPWCAPGSFELHRVEDRPRVLLPLDEM